MYTTVTQKETNIHKSSEHEMQKPQKEAKEKVELKDDQYSYFLLQPLLLQQQFRNHIQLLALTSTIFSQTVF